MALKIKQKLVLRFLRIVATEILKKSATGILKKIGPNILKDHLTHEFSKHTKI